MNKILTRKKTKESLHEQTSPVDSNPPKLPQSPPQQSQRKLWRRKKNQTETQKEFNPDSFLPATDSFRTSLIMPNLSTRFSMLREQDDPLSLLGKANDDSVLEPKRRSRLGDFGFQAGGLDDIAEISSLRPVRPPFASQRQASFASGDGYATDDDSSVYSGSIMTRARPGEGNVLFGGRQKIYKIPIGDAGSVRSMGAGEGRGMRGRALYEDDVSMSAFQRYRESEKQRQQQQQHDQDSDRRPLGKDLSFDSDRDAEGDRDALNSPVLSSYNERRATSSSTNSGPSMLSSSTAATSITTAASSPALPTASPAYNANAAFDSPTTKGRRLYEQGLDQHISDQQTAALHRIHSMQKKPTANGGAPYLAQSRSASNIRESYSRSPSTSRTASPMPPFSSEQISSLGSTQQRRPSAQTKNSSSSLSPVLSPVEVDKPEGDALNQALDPADRGKATAMGAFQRPKKFDEQQYSQRQKSLMQSQSQSQNLRPARNNIGSRANTPPARPAPRPSTEDMRERAGSTRTDRSWSASSSLRQISTRNGSIEAESATSHDLTRSTSEASEYKTAAPSQKSISSIGAGESDGEAYDEPPRRFGGSNRPSPLSTRNNTPSPLPACPPESEHPAFRAMSPLTAEDEASQKPAGLSLEPPTDETRQDSAVDFGADSPTLGSQQPSTRLAGMVRAHLRQRSNGSSIYHMPRADVEENAAPGFDFRIPSIYGVQSAQWGLDDYRTAYPDSPTIAAPNHESIPALITTVRVDNSAADDANADALNDGEEAADWERELRKHHARVGSSETQAERNAFANELAQRQRTIQENLRIKVENEARSQSPVSAPAATGLRPFALLRGKSSNEAMAASREISPRNQKLEAEKSRSPQPIGRTLHSRMPGAIEDHSRPSGESPRARREGERREHVVDIYRTDPQSLNAIRTRANSEASSKFATKNAVDSKESTPALPTSNGTKGIVSEMQQTFEGNRARKNSKAHRPPKISTENSTKTARNRNNSVPASATSESSRPSDSVETPYSANSTPPLFNASISPTSPYYAHAQAQANGIPSGEKVPFVFPGNMPRGNAHHSNRKKTINKLEISEPTLISHTSTIDTVSLPPQSSLRAGSIDSPPTSPPPVLPAMNPLRRGFLGAFSRSHSDNTVGNAAAALSGKKVKEIDEYGDELLTPGQRLQIRKVSSEHGDYNARKGRLMAVRADSPPNGNTGVI